MTYQAIARKWRPQSFRDIIGQQAVVRTLQNAIEQNRIHHAYLFSGVRGVGKTTTARIFAKALNCQNGPAKEPCNDCSICREITEGIDLDVREIDAATYSKAEDVRDLRELMQFQPARDRKRIFIIDEVHSLSGQAWNALLKQIEEPPPHVVFMMATTEMQKIPATILSRVQQLALRKITASEVVTRLEEICGAESITAEREALEMIARRGEGSVRDSLSLLDQVIAFSGNTLTLVDVASILGLADSRLFSQITEAVADGDSKRLFFLVDEASLSGRDFKLLYRDLLAFLRNLLLIVSGADESIIKADPEELASLAALSGRFGASELLRIVNLLLQDEETVIRSESQRLAVEIALLKAATFPRMRAIEDLLAGGVEPAARVAAAQGPRPANYVARSEPSAVARPQETPDKPTGKPAFSPPGESVEGFIERVESQRRMTASYLLQARRSTVSNDDITFEFEASETFVVDYVNDTDQQTFLEDAAAAEFGRPMKVRAVFPREQAATQPAKKASANPIKEDPVVQSFQKHLGGEVVRPTKKKS